MSIISDIADTIGEVNKTISKLSTSKDRIMSAGREAGEEKRFFERPMASIARQAKKSVLYFPIVASESLSAEVQATIAKAVQVRAAEYCRLMVANMGPISSVADGGGKQAVISALRGATLVDPLLGEAVKEISAYVRANTMSLIEHTILEDGLRAPLTEAINPRKHGGKGNPNKATGGKQAPQGKPQRNQQTPSATPPIPPFVMPTKYMGTPLPPHLNPVLTPSTPSHLMTEELEKMLDRASVLYRSKSVLARSEALKLVEKIMRSGHHNAMGQIGAAGLHDLAQEVEDSFIKNQSDVTDKKKYDEPSAQEERRRNSAVQQEIERQEALVQRVIDLASRGTNQSRSAAIELAQQVMAENNERGIATLRSNAYTAPIIAMLDRLPNGVIQDGSYNISRTGNRAEVVSNIDFNKLNQFQPILLNLTIRYEVDGAPSPITDDITLGVKGVAHSIPSVDLVTGLGTALARDNLTLQFFRMTSGETSFLKDFVLNMNVAKSRASVRTTSGTKVLETLRRQSEWNERRGNWFTAAITQRGFVPPTATIVITSDEVDRIRTLYGVDFSKPAVTRDLLRSHNLMGFMIVDEAIGMVRIFEDGDDDFDRLPLSTLKAQGKETSVRDIMTIMARG